MSTSEAPRPAARRSARPIGCPSVAAAVVRKGELAWSDAVGSASYDEDREATPGTQYRIGSITKTFTATAIMQLRGRRSWTSTTGSGQHLDGIAERLADDQTHARAHLGPTARGGGDVRRRATTPTEERSRGSRIALRPLGRQHHYSNLAFGLLGRVVAAKSGMAYTRVRRRTDHRAARACRTTWRSQEPKAQGYLVDEYARTVWIEPETEHRREWRHGPALVDGRGSRGLGDVPRATEQTACSTRRRSRRCGSPR